MHISFEYDRSCFPSFPVMELSVIGSGSNLRQTLWGLVDSGSDATQIPLSVLRAIQARDIDDRWVQEVSGARHLVTMYAVKLQIGTVDLPGMEVIGQQHYRRGYHRPRCPKLLHRYPQWIGPDDGHSGLRVSQDSILKAGTAVSLHKGSKWRMTICY
ncbi:MAG TPA: hypothetical protein PLD25_03695 [Chloroflexota bacterium]|nr:hypothetical protein [Chloroflexota bacterium]